MKSLDSLYLKRKKILGTFVDEGANKTQSFNVFENLLKIGNAKVFTINPEFLVDAWFDKDFQKILNIGDYNCNDGFGITLLYSLKRTPGINLTYYFLEYCNTHSLSIFILGGRQDKDVSKRATDEIIKMFPNIKIVGFNSSFSYKEEDDSRTLKYIHKCMVEKNVPKIDFILVGYGHKKQEFWINRNLTKIPCRVGMGVGGSLDFISKEIPRAPVFMQNFGIEWLFRLVIQPKRLFRILKAVVIFPFASFLEKITCR
jgi:N-acetylglucosaminyldiphosphoundecaprenol N-acetyl-beta-D-mannosaminyltransferase